MVAISLVTLACTVIISRRLTIKYLKPMGGIVDVANELAEGNFQSILMLYIMMKSVNLPRHSPTCHHDSGKLSQTSHMVSTRWLPATLTFSLR